MKRRELLMKPWSCVVPVDGWINGPVAAPQCRDDSSLAPTNHCSLCHTVDTGQLHNWNFNQCSVDLNRKQLDYFSQNVCSGLDINFLRRLSEPWFHLLIYTSFLIHWYLKMDNLPVKLSEDQIRMHLTSGQHLMPSPEFQFLILLLNWNHGLSACSNWSGTFFTHWLRGCHRWCG